MKNRRRNTILFIIAFIILIAIIIILIVIWSKSNVNKISQDEYITIVQDEAFHNNGVKYKTGDKAGEIVPLPTYDNSNIISFTANASVGQNTTIFTGIFNLADKSKVSYEAQFANGDFNPLSFSHYNKAGVGDFEDYVNSFTEQGQPMYDPPTSGGNLLSLLAATYNGSGAPLKNNVQVIDRNYIPSWESALISFIPILLLIGGTVFIFYLMYKAQGASGGLSIFNAGKNKARKEKSNFTFMDVAGIEEEKDELIEIVDYLKNPKKYSSSGARVPKGILLEGPPGTGKTLLAKALSGEAGVPFYSISGSEFDEVFVGIGASRIREMFKEAKKNSPCIIFIDEIDAMGSRRHGAIGGGVVDQTLNQLLTEMDGFSSNSGIIVIGATNLVVVLDPALLRPGRFDRKIQVALPDIKARVAILKLHARNKKISSAVDFLRLAQRTPGFSGAQLENVLNEAAILMVRHNAKMINLEIIDEAIDRVIGGPAKKSREYSFRDKQIVSYHEAGHALIGMKVSAADKVQKVTIIPRGRAGGYTIMTPKEEIMFHSKEQLYSNVTGLLGGRASEEIIFGKNAITTGSHDDLGKATAIARHIVTEFGMSGLGLTQFESAQQQAQQRNMIPQKMYSDKTAEAIDKQVTLILNECFEKAKTVIQANREELEIIAEGLRIVETITAEDIEYIDEKMELPPRIAEEKQLQAKHKKMRDEGDIVDVEPENDFAYHGAAQQEEGEAEGTLDIHPEKTDQSAKAKTKASKSLDKQKAKPTKK